uniref:Uncharacterized protein n=1 Tax=Aegilops tauschii subsp. strangulata TaxID=200361 RepID=A0A453DVC5_AEGTS
VNGGVHRGWRELQEPRCPSPWFSRRSRATIAVVIGALKRSALFSYFVLLLLPSQLSCSLTHFRFMGQATYMGVSAKQATGWVTK